MLDDDAGLRAAARHWSRVSSGPAPLPVRWWMHEEIVRHINRTICGQPVTGPAAGDVELLRGWLAGRSLETGISIGCGNGVKEMALLEAGVVQRFVLHEISDVRVAQGQRMAAERGLADRIDWRPSTVDFASAETDGRYELVYWNNALHHMTNTPAAVAWSRRSLRPGGVFYMNDFVGPDRMQWPDAMLEIASRLRRSLPARLLAVPDGSGRMLPTTLQRPDPAILIREDPTECADSSRILDSVRATFPGAFVKLTGGVIYHLALNDVLGNVTPDDRDLMRAWLLLDDLCSESGLTHYAVAMGFKPDHA